MNFLLFSQVSSWPEVVYQARLGQAECVVQLHLGHGVLRSEGIV